MRKWVFWWVALAACVLVPRAPGFGGATAKLVILFTGDVDGEIEPCGCPGSPSGGLARRATMLKQIARTGAATLVLDAGNALMRGTFALEPGARASDERHAAFMASLMARVGTQAVAVGPRDLWAVGLPGLKALARTHHLPWLSANIVDDRGVLVFPAALVLKAGALRIGVIGFTEPQDMVGRREGLSFLEVLPAARGPVGRLKGQVDVLVALSNLPAELNETLRTGVPELDLIITGPPYEGGTLITGDRPPWTARVSGLGRSLGRLDLRLTPGSRSPLVRSPQLEHRLVSLEAAHHSLRMLKEQLILEDGKLDPKRFEEQGAFLRARVTKLSVEAESAAGGRIFGYRQVPLDDGVPEDAAIATSVREFKRTTGGAGPARSAKPTDSRRF